MVVGMHGENGCYYDTRVIDYGLGRYGIILYGLLFNSERAVTSRLTEFAFVLHPALHLLATRGKTTVQPLRVGT